MACFGAFLSRVVDRAKTDEVALSVATGRAEKFAIMRAMCYEKRSNKRPIADDISELTMNYTPGNKFSSRINICDAAVGWAGLTGDVLQSIQVTDEGYPTLPGYDELRARAEALYEAALDGEIEARARTDAGYPLPPHMVLLQRASYESWLRKRTTSSAAPVMAPEAPVMETFLSAEETASLMGYSTKTLQRRRADGLFPEPDRLEPLGWRLAVVEAKRNGRA